MVLILVPVALESTMVMVMTLVVSASVLPEILLHIRQLLHQLLWQILEEIILRCVGLLHHSLIKASVASDFTLIHEAWNGSLHHLVHFLRRLIKWSNPSLCLI